MNVLFGEPISASFSPTSVAEHADEDRAEVFTPRKRTWADIKYKGDWMRRPISDNEVAWLVRLLVRLSDWLNKVLGLDRIDNTDSASPTYVDVPCDDMGYIGGPKDALFMAVCLVGSWFSFVVHSVGRFMRGRGMRINLRPLASKKFVMVLAVYATGCVLKKVFWIGTGTGTGESS